MSRRIVADITDKQFQAVRAALGEAYTAATRPEDKRVIRAVKQRLIAAWETPPPSGILATIEGWVWCDVEAMVHDDSRDPFTMGDDSDCHPVELDDGLIYEPHSPIYRRLP